MNIQIPYRRRKSIAEEKILQSAKPKRGAGPSVVLTWISSFLGAFLASALTLWVTLNTLESFKAEENLRQLALNELYRPLVKSTIECNSKRTQYLNLLAMHEGHLKIISGYAQELSKIPRGEEIGGLLTPPPEVAMKQFEDVSSRLTQAFTLSNEIIACERENLDNWATLGSILGIDQDFSKTRFERMKATIPKLGLIRDDEFILKLINDPKFGMSLATAIHDGASGNPTRLSAVMDRLKSELKKTSSHASRVYAQEREIYLYVQKSDFEINKLMLTNLKERFAKTPSSYLPKLPFTEGGK